VEVLLNKARVKSEIARYKGKQHNSVIPFSPGNEISMCISIISEVEYTFMFKDTAFFPFSF
jgi:hypothetical protein